MSFSPTDVLSAADSGEPATLRHVLGSGGDPSAGGTKGLTPLCAAVLALENSVEQRAQDSLETTVTSELPLLRRHVAQCGGVDVSPFF
jgi:hypothetical protein